VATDPNILLILRIVRQILNNQGVQMALDSELGAQLQTEIAALQAEDGIVIQTLNDLLTKAQSGGSVSDTDVADAVGRIKDEVAKLGAAVQSANPGPAPSA
jgi:hypothetical protein